MKLEADWLNSPQVQALFALLTGAGHSLHAVGGCVRNTLLGQPVADIDFACSAPPETVTALAEAAGHRVLPTGIAHGTVTVLMGDAAFEVTTWRQDVATDGRRATIAYATRLEDDAARRDFTMNALYVDADGEISDPVSGLPDIAARRLRFIGDPAARIAEDYLRILRYFRFFAWYCTGLDAGQTTRPDAQELAAITAGLAGLSGLSAERVGAELARLLAAPNPVEALDLMEKTGVLGAVLPGASLALMPGLMHAETLAALPADWRRRLAALAPRANWADRLRLSKADARYLSDINKADAAESLAVTAYRFGADVARDYALLGAARGAALPINWQAEITRGLAAEFPLRAVNLPHLIGPALGAALREAKQHWLKSDLRADAAGLLAQS